MNLCEKYRWCCGYSIAGTLILEQNITLYVRTKSIKNNFQMNPIDAYFQIHPNNKQLYKSNANQCLTQNCVIVFISA